MRTKEIIFRSILVSLFCIASLLNLISPSSANSYRFFTTPFKNIYCIYDSGANVSDTWVVCTIDKVSKLSFRIVPKYCEEWSEYFSGKTFYLRGDSKPRLYCDPGDLWPLDLKVSDFKIVPYGQSIKIGDIRCYAGNRTTPMICINKLGFGFSLSKSAQRLIQ